ncbi:uncharacterized protein DNG_09866 [Cephalotrichum gorgonifer]|uniref:Zn(2)-C6 fungal-type domain-containing protein n=1 Tax=Cephalotrichum gorgonifer TaxID=2041049 RepID=A0AAE8T0F2_9PEZI|nr:uncharacterized protein DNG_09866 [Cephalotrichum gorgonifer]
MSLSGFRNRLACAACTRRKVKCSKTVPCTNCVRRGEQDSCVEGSDAYSTTSTIVGRSAAGLSSPQLTRHDQHDVDALRRRVSELEAELQRGSSASEPSPPMEMTRQQQQHQQSGIFVDERGDQNQGDNRDRNHQREEPARDAVVEDAASILEFLAWGRRKNPDYQSVASPETVLNVDQVAGNVRDAHVQPELPAAQHPTLEDLSQPSVLQLLLPDQRRVWQLVDWHEHCVLWYHCSYYAPTLRKQLESFYSIYAGSIENSEVNLQWVAFLFAVLTGSMTCVSSHTAEVWGYRDSERETLSKKWFQAVIACLNQADYAANHSILSVQAIATLTISAHMLGFSNMQSIYLAAAVRIAQSLGLHRLTPETPGSFVEKETGRRAWTQLCSQDWFSLPFSETYLVNPLYSKSEPPLNCDDGEVVPLPESVPTVTSYARFLSSIAAIMPPLQDGLISCNTPFTKYEQIIKYDKQLRSLATSGRPTFLSNLPMEPGWPIYIPWARRALAISSSHKIIMIHRSFLSESFTKPAFAFTRRTCLAASKTIIKEYKCVVEEDGPVIWIHQAFSIAASIILILDILHREPGEREIAEHRQLIEDIVEILKKYRNSMIAVRGAKLLCALLEEIANISNDASRKRRLEDDADNRAQKRFRGFNVPVFVKSFCEGQRSSIRSPAQQQLHSPHAALMQTMPIDTFTDIGNFEATTSFENLLYLANNDFYSF